MKRLVEGLEMDKDPSENEQVGRGQREKKRKEFSSDEEEDIQVEKVNL